MNVAAGLANGMRAGIPSVQSAATSLGNAAGSVATYANAQTGAAYSAGLNVAAGLASGISAGRSSVVNAAASVAAAAISAANSTLAVNSPSRVFKRIGEEVDEGFILGIRGGSGLVKSAVDKAFSFENPASFKTAQAGYANSNGNYNMLVAAFSEALDRANLRINYNGREFARVIAAAH